jgi:hypothetical protein
MMEPKNLVDSPTKVITYQRKLGWARELIQDAERYGTPNKTSRESKRPRLYSNYVALVSTSLMQNLSAMKKLLRRKCGRLLSLKNMNQL